MGENDYLLPRNLRQSERVIHVTRDDQSYQPILGLGIVIFSGTSILITPRNPYLVDGGGITGWLVEELLGIEGGAITTSPHLLFDTV